MFSCIFCLTIKLYRINSYETMTYTQHKMSYFKRNMTFCHIKMMYYHILKMYYIFAFFVCYFFKYRQKKRKTQIGFTLPQINVL